MADRRGIRSRACDEPPHGPAQLRVGTHGRHAVAPHQPSARLLRQLGFVREGVLRSYRGAGRDRVAFSILPHELTER
jgi:hypothetical protein